MNEQLDEFRKHILDALSYASCGVAYKDLLPNPSFELKADNLITHHLELIREEKIKELEGLFIEKLNTSKMTTSHADAYNMAAEDYNYTITKRIKELKKGLIK